jgi:glycine cleavage system H protein
MQTPEALRYAPSHEWSTSPDESVITVGITDFAQDQLGDVVFVELPDLGRVCRAGEAIAVVESVKTASDIYTPMAGEVIAVNNILNDAPETINEDPYGQGWLFKIRVVDAAAWSTLLDAAGYMAIAEEG